MLGRYENLRCVLSSVNTAPRYVGLGPRGKREVVRRFAACDHTLAEYSEIESGRRDNRPQLYEALGLVAGAKLTQGLREAGVIQPSLPPVPPPMLFCVSHRGPEMLCG